MYKSCVFLLVAMLAVGEGVQPTNYDISRNQVGGPGNGIGISNILDYLLGGYGGHRPAYGPGYGAGYGSGYGPGFGYPGNHGPPGPPGAHPGCPLCDSSVYSYCSHKQAHDACCCGNAGYHTYGCYQSDCKFLYANSCEEFDLITNCCCVDLYKNNPQPAAVVV